MGFRVIAWNAIKVSTNPLSLATVTSGYLDVKVYESTVHSNTDNNTAQHANL